MLIETTKEDLKLAKAEIEAFTKTKKYKNYFYTEDLPKNVYSRFALANYVYEEITSIKIPKTFKVIGKGNKVTSLIRSLIERGSKVNLTNPEAEFHVIRNQLYEKVYTNRKNYLKRNPKFRPGFHPAACSAKLARILVNLAGNSKNILDPFCGTGGIIIEARLMGVKAEGSDLNREMVEKTKINLKHYKIKAKVLQKDALKIKGKYDSIVTELPFGITTKIESSIEKLLNDFMKVAKKTTKKLIIVVPDSKYYLKPKFTHRIYIHKSLSKRIMIFDL